MNYITIGAMPNTNSLPRGGWEGFPVVMALSCDRDILRTKFEVWSNLLEQLGFLPEALGSVLVLLRLDCDRTNKKPKKVRALSAIVPPLRLNRRDLNSKIRVLTHQVSLLKHYPFPNLCFCIKLVEM